MGVCNFRKNGVCGGPGVFLPVARLGRAVSPRVGRRIFAIDQSEPASAYATPQCMNRTAPGPSLPKTRTWNFIGRARDCRRLEITTTIISHNRQYCTYENCELQSSFLTFWQKAFTLKGGYKTTDLKISNCVDFQLLPVPIILETIGSWNYLIMLPINESSDFSKILALLIQALRWKRMRHDLHYY